MFILRGEIKAILKKIKTPTNNITKEEKKALAEVRRDSNKIILTVDKGVSLVVMNKEDYQKKALELMDQPTYKTLAADPTNKHKNKLITLLKSIKSEGGIDDITYKKLYPTGAVTPKFYGLPKVHKAGVPLRPIVSSIGAVSYETSKELSRILKPLVGHSPYHVHNNQDFLQQLQEQKLGPDDIIMSYDVKALFTSVPIQPSIDIITKLLEKDPSLSKRTNMNIRQIISLLEFCLRGTYFTFQNKYYEQIEGTAMGSAISPIVANLYMEDLESKAIQSAPHPPVFWKRFVDDTFVIIKSFHKQEFLDHINSIDTNIQFTIEESSEDGSMPFLDMLILPQEDGSFHTTIYRKPTHTDMYLQWDSQHPISSKYSVVGTLHHRASTVCSNIRLFKQEEQHLQAALTRCKYPNWALNRIKMKLRSNQKKKKNRNQNQNTLTKNYQQPYLVVPYYQGLSESVKRTCNKYGIQVHFRGGVTIKGLLMAPKDPDPMLKRSGVIYKYTCDRVECDEEYIGESSRNFNERFKEHQKAPSPICDHYTTTGHDIKVENFTIVGKEDQNLKRAIKESMYIRTNDPSLNRNVGKYHLPHIWDEVLFDTPELKLN